MIEPPSEKIGKEVLVNSRRKHDQLYPSVAGFGTGKFIVTWGSSGQDNVTSFGVYGQRFKAAD
ncbi:MAG TPA: hypothetical protein VGA77_07115 [Propylenella sp.]